MYHEVEASAVATVPEHQLLRQIGKGACGVVWLARNSLGSWRAVKLVAPDGADGSGANERELAGLRLYEPISHQHPGLLPILAAGRDPITGVLWSVMELADDVQGADGERLNPNAYQPETLEERLRRNGGRLPAPEVLKLLLPIAGGLAHMHARGVVHRDVKPCNILFVRGTARLADCGLVNTSAAAKTYVGTPGYIAPEGPGRPGADVFAFGKVLYRAAFGRNPGDWPNLPTVFGETPDSWLEAQLNEVMLRSLADDPAQRYPDGSALLADLERVASGQALLPRPRPLPAAPEPGLLARLDAAAAGLGGVVLTAFGILGLVAVAILVVAGGYGWFQGWIPRPGVGRPAQGRPDDPVRILRLSAGGFAVPVETRTYRLSAPGPWIDHSLLSIPTRQGPTTQVAAVERNVLHFLDDEGAPLQVWNIPNDGQNLRIYGVGDWDRDGSPEAMVSWSVGTQAHLAFVTPRPFAQNQISESAVMERGSKDREYVQTTFKPLATDVHPDTGRPLLLVQLNDGKVLPPGRSRRQLIAYEVTATNPVPAWRVDLPAGCDESIEVVPENAAGIGYVLTTYAPSNGHVAPDGADDGHSWLYVLDRRGRVMWRRELGDVFVRSEAHTIRWPDGSLEIATLSSANADYRGDLGFLPPAQHEVGRLVIFDVAGNELHRREHDCQIVAWSPPRPRSAATGPDSPRSARLHAAVDSRGVQLLLNRSLELDEAKPLLPLTEDRLMVRFIGTGPLLAPDAPATAWLMWRERPITLPKLGTPGQQAAIFERTQQEILVWDADLNPRVHLQVDGPARTKAAPDRLLIVPPATPRTRAELILTGRDTITRIAVP